MSRYTITQVTAALERAVAERGEDYVYRKRPVPSSEVFGGVINVCLYRTPPTDADGHPVSDAGDPASDEADCGVGRVLQLLGDRAWDAVCDPNAIAHLGDFADAPALRLNRVSIIHHAWDARSDLTRAQRGALGAFQDAQDAGFAWDHALASYRRYVAVHTWPTEDENANEEAWSWA